MDFLTDMLEKLVKVVRTNLQIHNALMFEIATKDMTLEGKQRLEQKLDKVREKAEQK